MPIPRRLRAIGAVISCCVIALAARATAQFSTPRIDVQVAGHGEPSLIFIPGLAAPGAVWDHVVARFEVAYRCHVVTLAGFGGKPPVRTEQFLDEMADAVIAYAREQKLEKPVLIGHSLGGVLALKIAVKAPDLPGRLVIVDSLPFLAGLMKPGVNDAAAAQQVADSFRKTYATETPAQFAETQRKLIAGLVTSPEQAASLAEQTSKSDPSTAGEAVSEMIVSDLRAKLDVIRCPTLVLAAMDKEARGISRTTIKEVFPRQYEKLAGVRIVFFEQARHYIMLDDLDGFTDALRKELIAR